jgi:hypothetical protein
MQQGDVIRHDNMVQQQSDVARCNNKTMKQGEARK